MSETITRLRGTPGTDARNNAVIDWSDPDELEINDVAMAPRTSSEDNQGRQAVIVGWTLYGPYEADVEPRDRIRWGDDIYEVDGEPGRWQSPFTRREAGLEVALKRVDG